MTVNKKALRKQKDSKRRAGKATPTKRVSAQQKLAVKRKPAKKKAAAKSKTATRKLVKSKKAPKKVAVKTKVTVKKKLGPRRARAVTKLAPDESQMLDTALFSPTRIVGHSGSQSGDLQGLSGVESSDSESVDELLEEGNAFEAGVVMGVEDAGDADLEEVRTHQVPE